MTDLDGTLLNDAGEISPRARAALGELNRRGAVVALSTARPPRTALPIQQALELNGPLICYNGALLYDPDNSRPIVHHPIPKDVAIGIVECLQHVGPDFEIGLELADEWHVDRMTERLRRRFSEGWFAVPPLVGDLVKVLRTTGREVSKVYYLGNDALRPAVEMEIAAKGLSASVSVTSSSPGMVEIMAAGVDKGAALRALAAILGIPRHEVLALGDAENDVPALQAAGLGVAMGNASDEVKKAATVVAASNNEDGWARAVEQIALSV